MTSATVTRWVPSRVDFCWIGDQAVGRGGGATQSFLLAHVAPQPPAGSPVTLSVWEGDRLIAITIYPDRPDVPLLRFIAPDGGTTRLRAELEVTLDGVGAHRSMVELDPDLRGGGTQVVSLGLKGRRLRATWVDPSPVEEAEPTNRPILELRSAIRSDDNGRAIGPAVPGTQSPLRLRVTTQLEPEGPAPPIDAGPGQDNRGWFSLRFGVGAPPRGMAITVASQERGRTPTELAAAVSVHRIPRAAASVVALPPAFALARGASPKPSMVDPLFRQDDPESPLHFRLRPQPRDLVVMVFRPDVVEVTLPDGARASMEDGPNGTRFVKLSVGKDYVLRPVGDDDREPSWSGAPDDVSTIKVPDIIKSVTQSLVEETAGRESYIDYIQSYFYYYFGSEIYKPFEIARKIDLTSKNSINLLISILQIQNLSRDAKAQEAVFTEPGFAGQAMARLFSPMAPLMAGNENLRRLIGPAGETARHALDGASGAGTLASAVARVLAAGEFNADHARTLAWLRQGARGGGHADPEYAASVALLMVFRGLRAEVETCRDLWLLPDAFDVVADPTLSTTLGDLRRLVYDHPPALWEAVCAADTGTSETGMAAGPVRQLRHRLDSLDDLSGLDNPPVASLSEALVWSASIRLADVLAAWGALTAGLARQPEAALRAPPSVKELQAISLHENRDPGSAPELRALEQMARDADWPSVARQALLAVRWRAAALRAWTRDLERIGIARLGTVGRELAADLDGLLASGSPERESGALQAWDILRRQPDTSLAGESDPRVEAASNVVHFVDGEEIDPDQERQALDGARAALQRRRSRTEALREELRQLILRRRDLVATGVAAEADNEQVDSLATLFAMAAYRTEFAEALRETQGKMNDAFKRLVADGAPDIADIEERLRKYNTLMAREVLDYPEVVADNGLRLQTLAHGMEALTTEIAARADGGR